MSAADGLNRISDDFTANERVTHTFSTIGNAVAYADCVEDEPDKFLVPDTLFDFRRKPVEVHVAGVAVVPGADDTNLGFCQVVIGQAGAIQHRLSCRQGGILCKSLA